MPDLDLDDLARLAEVAKAEAMPAEGVYTNTGLVALRMFQQFATPEVVAELVERVKRAEAENAEMRMALTEEARQLAQATVHTASAIGALRLSIGEQMVKLGYEGLLERLERAEAVIAGVKRLAELDVRCPCCTGYGNILDALATYQNGADH